MQICIYVLLNDWDLHRTKYWDFNGTGASCSSYKLHEFRSSTPVDELAWVWVSWNNTGLRQVWNFGLNYNEVYCFSSQNRAKGASFGFVFLKLASDPKPFAACNPIDKISITPTTQSEHTIHAALCIIVKLIAQIWNAIKTSSAFSLQQYLMETLPQTYVSNYRLRLTQVW